MKYEGNSGNGRNPMNERSPVIGKRMEYEWGSGRERNPMDERGTP
jgi:hypothetical protein